MAMIRFRVATEFNVVSVVVSEEVQQRVERLKAAGICLGCEKPIPDGSTVRLCQCETCSSGTYNALRQGYVTKDELLAQGKIAYGKKGPKGKNDYTRSLSKKSK